MSWPTLSKGKFLIVDDEVSNVRLLERALAFAKSGPVFSTTDARKALELFHETQPDIVLLDLHMPHVDGFELIAKIKAALPAGAYLPILVLTADVTPEIRQHALSRGAQDFLTKPLDPQEVLLRIGNLLETRFLHLELQQQNSDLERLVLKRTAQLEDALHRLTAAQQQLVKQERLRALGMMASGVAHDFNNALTMVLGHGALLYPFFEKDAPAAECEKFQNLMAAAEDASHVVTRLRDFYRPADQDELRVPVDVNLSIQQAIVLTAPRWRDKCRANGIVLEVETDFTDVPHFVGHPPEFREILTNLIFNAIDAMPAGGKLRFSTTSSDGLIYVSVTDTGIGMSEEEASRCLEPFFTTKGELGTGLGLAAVYGFVQRYGGSLGIDTRRGQGTTFNIVLPASGEMLLPAQVLPASTERSLRVLVVDDQEIIRNIISEMLRAEGHTASPVADGLAVLEALKSGSWDLVISDQSMPGMTGVQIAAEAMAAGIAVRFILLTGFGDEMRAKGGTPLGVDLLLSKPLTINVLRRALGEVFPPS